MTPIRRALVYGAAWTPYAASYFVLFRSFTNSRVALLQTAYNILPAMLLGLAVLRWARLYPWAKHRRGWFYPLHLGSALAYSTLWYLGVLLLGSLGQAVATHRFELGYFSSYAVQWQFVSGLMIYGNLAGFAFIAQVNRKLREEEHRRTHAEALQTESELAVLRAQLNPHFLFNTLNSLVALAALDRARVADAIVQLSEMLRYTLQEHRTGGDRDVSLREELAFTDQYLALEALRLGNRLSVKRQISHEALAWRLPALTVQPLVENAIRHGIAPRARGGTILLTADVRGDVLHLDVHDDGLGAEPMEVTAGDGIGIKTVQQRLALFSGGQASLGVHGSPSEGLRVSIKLPRLDSGDLVEQKLSGKVQTR